MQWIHAQRPENIRTFIEAHPAEEAVFVRDMPPVGNPRDYAIGLCHGRRVLLTDFDGTATWNNQWEDYERFIKSRTTYFPWAPDPVMAALADELPRIRDWYAKRKSMRPESLMDAWSESWSDDRQDAVQAMWVVMPVMGLVYAGMTREDHRQLCRGIKLRDGMHELLMHHAFLRTVIVSFGLEDTIREVIFQHGVTRSSKGPHVAATRLRWHEDRLLACDPNVLTANLKGTAVNAFLRDEYTGADCIVVGDAIFDLTMAPPGATRIFLSPPDHDGKAHGNTFRNLDELWAGSDLILRSNSLHPLVDLLNAPLL